jgi:hypothetical protein
MQREIDKITGSQFREQCPAQSPRVFGRRLKREHVGHVPQRPVGQPRLDLVELGQRRHGEEDSDATSLEIPQRAMFVGQQGKEPAFPTTLERAGAWVIPNHQA